MSGNVSGNDRGERPQHSGECDRECDTTRMTGYPSVPILTRRIPHCNTGFLCLAVPRRLSASALLATAPATIV